MTVYEWMFETPYFLAIIVIGTTALTVDVIAEQYTRRRAAKQRRCRHHHPASQVGTRKVQP